MAFKSYEQWKAEREGKTLTSAGVASAAPASGTPLDTGTGTRPRMTFEQWKSQKQATPQVSPEVTKDVAQAPIPTTQEQPGIMDNVGAALKNYATAPLTTSVGAISGLMAGAGQLVQSGLAAVTPFVESTENPIDIALQGQQLGKQEIAPFIKEEALPTAGAIAATTLAPELTIPVAAGRYGAALSALSKGIYSGLTGGAGATGGSLIRETAKKEGWLQPQAGQTAPSDWSGVFENAVNRGSEEAAWTGATAVALGMVPPALRSIVRLGSSPRESMDAFVGIMERRGGPVLLSDMEDGIFINMADSAASHSFMASGKEMKEIRQAQLRGIAAEATDVLPELAAKAGGTIEKYQDGVLSSLPSNVLAAHLTVALKDGERVARGVVGSRYDAIDNLAETIGVKTVNRHTVEIVRDPDGKAIFDPVFNRVVTRPRVETVTLPKYTVDVRPAKDVIQGLIDAQANTLQAGAREDFTKFAREQVNLFRLKDDLTFREARNIVSDMDKEARRLAAATTDEFAATKRKFLLDSIVKFRDAMEVTGKQMADDGLMLDGMSIDSYLRETNKQWAGITEDFGNKYVQSFINKADKVEGAADTLALSFLQSRESSNALLKALDSAEAAAGAPKMREYVTGTAEEVQQVLPKARAAVSFKVYENLLSMYFNPATKGKALNMLNDPDMRGTMSQLMGNDMFNRGEEVIRALKQLEDARVDIGAFTQFARESGALLDTASVIGSAGSKGNPARIIATLSAPMVFSHILKDPKMLKMAKGISVEDDLTRKIATFTELTRMGVKGFLNDYSNMTEEERELMEYRVKLQQL